MKSTLIWLLALALVSLCARTAPLPSDAYSSSSRRSIPRASRNAARLSHVRRGDASALKETAESAEHAVAATKMKDWKRPIVITISAVGLAMTIGWNYISAKSFFSNRAKYYREKKRLEEERKKPPPQVGDTMCTVQTYYTGDQVESRKPTLVKAPCYVLGQQQSMGQQSSAVQNTAQQQGAVVPQQPEHIASTGGGSSSSSLTAMLNRGGGISNGDGGAQAPTFSPQPQPPVVFTAQDVSTDAKPGASSTVEPAPAPDVDHNSGTPIDGPLNKRGLTSVTSLEAAHGIEAASHEIEEVALEVPSPSPPSSPSTSPTSSLRTSDDIPLLPLDVRGRTRFVFSPSGAARARGRPGFPVARPFDPVEFSPAFDDQQHSDVAHDDALPKIAADDKKDRVSSPRLKSKLNRWKVWSKLQGAKKIKTEDITFGLTVLNTIGNIPSLILTTINAMYYRGNPKVD
ncbi:hypothetical protein EX895_001695 [Sporisorium graminicola]|uniref:Uncharacterized protein n=1 Tax=Sporisorium graminicola TaxID=280036 RepID=A0A4U7KWN4_9BASI|nr:hypothetical protein EX895_001695 [Sporisorium graminicola]TKY89164.1 hypothetical protein EX895_001695 [Sporisorium graminicola]